MYASGGRGGGAGGRKVCPFFLQGKCKFGDNCYNEHPRTQTTQPNRFAPLQNSGGNSQQARSAHASSSNNHEFGVTVDNIRRDLTRGGDEGERPNWPLSAYAPGHGTPRQLLEGTVELSPEELRVQCYLSRARGAEQEYAQHESSMIAQADQQIQTILRDLEGAKRFCLEASHPNRSDLVVRPNRAFPWTVRPGNAPPPSQASSTGALSQPAFGNQSKPAFGQPSGVGNTHTAPPAFGSQSTSAFGQASALGAPKSAFGAPSSLGGRSAFGQPSPLGNNNTASSATTTGSTFGQPSAFGQASALGTSTNAPAFGKPSAFGQASSAGQSSAFGQASTPGQTSAFGQASTLGNTSTFGQASAFGQNDNKPAFGASSAPSGFGSPSAFGQSSNTADPTPQTTTSPFGQQSAAQPSAFGAGQSTFGQASAFGASAAAKASPFAQVASPAGNPPSTQNTAFGQPSPFATSTSNQISRPANNNFGAKPAFGQPSPFAAQPQPSQPVSSTPFTTQPATASQSSSQRTEIDPTTQHHYRIAPAPTPDNPNASRRERIWFPNGPPANVSDAMARESLEAPAEVYQNTANDLARVLEDVYRAVAEKGKFVELDGLMPEVPPKREWVSFDM